uniref:Regulator n=1 Tax=Meloidogyne hapla TaxID=6305 RepID=A0A1I8BRM9_MELHA
MNQNDNKDNVHRERVDKKVSGMSESAKEQFSEISATLNNKSLPDQERWQRVLQIYDKMEPGLRNEFEQKFKGFQSAFEN